MDLQPQPQPPLQGDDIAAALADRVARLSRLFLAQSSLRVSFTEVGVLQAVASEPRRITDLALAEGVTQPAITSLVNRLVERGWVVREADPCDRRVVLVTMTPAGHEARERLRAEYRELLHDGTSALPAQDVATLARAVEIIDALIAGL
jgi:DNA-binding MarR family transcriptional regulator